MPYTSPFARQGTYQPNTRLVDIILRQGEQQADAERRRGEIAGQAWQTIAGSLGEIAKHRADAPKRETEALQLKGLKADDDERATATAQETALRELFSSETPPAPEAIYRVVGPERGLKIVTGMAALQTQNQQAYANTQALVRDVLLGMDALPEGLRAEAYPAVRQNLLTRGIIQEQDAPPQYDAAWFKQARNYGKEPVRPVAAAPGTTFVNPETVQPGFTTPNPVAEATAADRVADNARADAAAKATEEYRTSQLGIQREQLAVAQQNAETARARSTALGTDASMPVDYRNVFERVVMSRPPNRRPALVAHANRLVAEGNLDELKSVIKQAAIEGENVDTKNQVLGRATTIDALKSVKSVLDDMKRQGVPTNILAGTLEDVARKLGTSTNPQYVTFATQLVATLVAYRRSITGAQFGETEAAEYYRMFPNYRQTSAVNAATIAGLLRQMQGNDRTYWDHKLGKDGMALLGVGQVDQADAAAKEGDTKEIPGFPGTEQTYKNGKWIRTK
jgi:hypothetical protein